MAAACTQVRKAAQDCTIGLPSAEDQKAVAHEISAFQVAFCLESCFKPATQLSFGQLHMCCIEYLLSFKQERQCALHQVSAHASSSASGGLEVTAHLEQVPV